MLDKILNTLCSKDKAIYEMSENENYYIVTTMNKYGNSPEDNDKTYAIDKKTFDIIENSDEQGTEIDIHREYRLVKYDIIEELNRKLGLRERLDLTPRIDENILNISAYIACTKGILNKRDLYALTYKIAEELNSIIFGDGSSLTLIDAYKNEFIRSIINETSYNLLLKADKYYWKPDVLDEYCVDMDSINYIIKNNQGPDKVFDGLKNKILSNISNVLDCINNTDKEFLDKDKIRNLVLVNFQETKKAIEFYERANKINTSIKKTPKFKKALNTFKSDVKSIGKDITNLVQESKKKKSTLTVQEAYELANNVSKEIKECYKVPKGFLFTYEDIPDTFDFASNNVRKAVLVYDNKNIRVDLKDIDIDSLIKIGKEVKLDRDNVDITLNDSDYIDLTLNDSDYLNCILIARCDINKGHFYTNILKEIIEVCNKVADDEAFCAISKIEKNSRYYTVTLENGKETKIKCRSLDTRKYKLVEDDDISNGSIYVPMIYRGAYENVSIYIGMFIYDRIQTIGMGGFGGIPITAGGVEDHCKYLREVWNMHYIKQIIKTDSHYVFEICGKHGEDLGIAPVIIMDNFGEVMSSIYPMSFYKGRNVDVPQNYRPIAEDSFIPNEPGGSFGRLSGVVVPNYTLGEVDPFESEDIILNTDEE